MSKSTKEQVGIAMSRISKLPSSKKDELIRSLLEYAIDSEYVGVRDSESIEWLIEESKEDGNPVSREELELPYYTTCGDPIINGSR